jgi:hypothetical protein
MKALFSKIMLILFLVVLSQSISSQKQMEKMGRGIVALNNGSNIGILFDL